MNQETFTLTLDGADVTAYPGDILSFLDSSVRTLDAMEDLASVEENPEMERRVGERKRDLL